MERKYELTDETMEYKGIILHRIKAVRDFGSVEKDDLGGWIEKEENLSQEGDCWVYDDAKVYGNAIVTHNARLWDYAEVYGHAEVRGSAVLGDYVRVCGHAFVSVETCIRDHSYIHGNAMVLGLSHVSGRTKVWGHAKIYDHAVVDGKVRVFGNAYICGNSEVDGKHITICGHTILSTDVSIGSNAFLSKTSHYLIVGPIGSRDGITTFYKTKNGIRVTCGCYSGTLKEFKKEVKLHHGKSEHGKAYFQAIKFAKERLKDKK